MVSKVSISAGDGPGPHNSTALNERRVFRSSRASGMWGLRRLERDELWFDRHPALAFCLRMIFSENRIPLFRIALGAVLAQAAADRRLVRRCKQPTGPGEKAQRQDQPNG